MQRVIALDPGGTTGWASWTNYEDPALSKFDRGQIGPHDHHNELDALLGIQQTDYYTIVCERFEYRNTSRSGLNLMSREYIGVVKHFAQERMLGNDDQALVFQNASQAKGFVADRHLKKLDLWYPGYKHAMDATRHLLFYLINGTGYPIGRQLLEVGWK